MSETKNWFEVIKQKDYFYIIRERLDEVDPRYHTEYSNLFLVKGGDSALLIDTGCGLYPLKPIVSEIIGDLKLIVLNTHSHWDHVCGNHEFGEIYIHELEYKSILASVNLSLLKDSPAEKSREYQKHNYEIPPAHTIHKVIDGQRIDLGNVSIKIIHTPGHSPGSISLLSNRGELFTGDLVHEGSVYLPKKKNFPIVISSLNKLFKIIKEELNNDVEIYPSHENVPLGIDVISKFLLGIQYIEERWNERKKDSFLRSWIVEDKNFKYVISRI